MSTLYPAFVTASTLEGVALRTTIALSIHASYLQRHLKDWRESDLELLVVERTIIQLRLPSLYSTQFFQLDVQKEDA